MNEPETIINQEETNTNQMYLDEIQKLKANTVSRERYEQLMQENKNLLTTLVNGQQVSAETETPKATADEVRARFNPRMTNLDYVINALELREAAMREGKVDPFVGEHNTAPTREAMESAQRVADAFAECIKSSNGNPEVFTANLQSMMIDVPVPPRY